MTVIKPERGGHLSSLKEDDRLVVEFTQLSIARSGKCHYARVCCRKSLGHSARGVRAVARNLPVRFQGAARAGGKALHDKDCDPGHCSNPPRGAAFPADRSRPRQRSPHSHACKCVCESLCVILCCCSSGAMRSTFLFMALFGGEGILRRASFLSPARAARFVTKGRMTIACAPVRAIHNPWRIMELWPRRAVRDVGKNGDRP